MNTKKQLLGAIDFYSGNKSREKYIKEDSTVDGITRVANMERQITDLFSDFLNRLSSLRYDVGSGPMGYGGYGSNFTPEDMEEIEATKKNMKEFAAKKLAKATQLVDIIFSQVGATKAVVVIGKVDKPLEKVEKEIEDEEKAKSDDVEDEDTPDVTEAATNQYGDESGNNNGNFYDDKENKFVYDAKSLEKFEGQSVVITKKNNAKI